MPKTKSGEKITWKEFMSRWKEGIENISPKDKLRHQLRGYKITMLGLICGIGVSIYGYDRLWWLGIILLGGLYINAMQYLGLREQVKMLDKMEAQMNEM